ncbi:MAG: type II toxin-antitoxin system Phd/YefM family antitoxin [Candidatus Hydrogenedentes bacterium]|nr:type II toxin-antitoxin system Phd/YefM family antitoxin [Candidatus Hydrogenedentota bacterium]
MKTVNIHEAKTQLSRLLREVKEGEEIVIANAGEPVAKLVAYTEIKAPREPGRWAGKIWIADDFDELPQEVISSF